MSMTHETAPVIPRTCPTWCNTDHYRQAVETPTLDNGHARLVGEASTPGAGWNVWIAEVTEDMAEFMATYASAIDARRPRISIENGPHMRINVSVADARSLAAILTRAADLVEFSG